MKKDILLKGLIFLRVICLVIALYIWGTNTFFLYEIDHNTIYPLFIQCLILLYIYNNIDNRKINHILIYLAMVSIPVISVFLFYGYKSFEEQMVLVIFYWIVTGIMYTKLGKIQYLHKEQKWFTKKIFLWIALITMMFLINHSASVEVVNYFLLLFFVNLIVLNEIRQKEFNIKDKATRNIYGLLIIVSFLLTGWNGALNKGLMAIKRVYDVIVDSIIKIISPLIYLLSTGISKFVNWVMSLFEKGGNSQSYGDGIADGNAPKKIEMDINYIRNQKIIRVIILIILIGIIVLIILKLFKKRTMQGFNSLEYKEITEELQPEDNSTIEVKKVIYEGLDGKIKENFRKIQLKSIPVDKYKKNMTATEFMNNIKDNDENLIQVREIYNRIKFSDEKINEDICEDYLEKVGKILELDVFTKK